MPLCLHQVQGGYYVKGFSKHGPLHNPYTYGYFEHVKHTGHVGGHVTCGGIVYQGGAFPDDVSTTPTSPRTCCRTRSIGARSSPTVRRSRRGYVGTLLETDDIWFRPIDCLTGPDGSVYVADWYDQRANHVIPEDTWDKTNGRIWKIVYRGTKPAGSFDVGQANERRVGRPVEQPECLAAARGPAHSVRAARSGRLAAAGENSSSRTTDEPLALEALWALYASGRWNDELALALARSSQAPTCGPGPCACSATSRASCPRPFASGWFAWPPTTPARSSAANWLARPSDSLPPMRCRSSRSYCAAARTPPTRTFRCLLWWAIEDKAVSQPDAVLQLLAESDAWQLPLVRDTIIERLARRYMAERNEAGYAACARLLALAPNRDEVRRIVAAMEKESSGQRLAQVPAPLSEPLAKLWRTDGADPTVTRLALRLGSAEAYASALARLADANEPAAVRLAFIAAVGQAGSQDAVAPLVAQLNASQPEPIRLAALAALAHFDDDAIAARPCSTATQDFSGTLRSRALDILCSRKSWSQALLDAVAAGKIDPKDVSVEQIRQMLAHDDARLAAAIETRWGKIRPATPGEKQAYVPVLGRVLEPRHGRPGRGARLVHQALRHLPHVVRRGK